MVGITLTHDLRHAGDARRLRVGVVVENAVADAHLVPHEVARGVVAHPVPDYFALDYLNSAFELVGYNFESTHFNLATQKELIIPFFGKNWKLEEGLIEDNLVDVNVTAGVCEASQVVQIQAAGDKAAGTTNTKFESNGAKRLYIIRDADQVTASVTDPTFTDVGSGVIGSPDNCHDQDGNTLTTFRSSSSQGQAQTRFDFLTLATRDWSVVFDKTEKLSSV